MLKSFRDYFLTFLIAIIIFAIVAYFLVGYIINNVFNSSTVVNPDSTDTSQVSPADTDNPGDPTTPSNPEDDESYSFNFLFIGIDYQPDILSDYNKKIIDKMFPGNSYKSTVNYNMKELGLDTPAARNVTADSIMLIRVDKEHKQFTYTALPSNMLLSIFGNDATLGSLYQDYGIQFLIDKVYAITGLPVDYYAVTTIPACKKIIDMFDGITYTVPCDMEYSDPEQNLQISLKAGSQKLSGEQALQLLRFNNYTDNTNSRLKTMISFSKAMIAKMTNVLYISKANDLFSTASKAVTTNLSLEEFSKNLNLIFSYSSFETLDLTYPGSYSYVNGVQYFMPNIEKAISDFKDYRRN